MLPWCPRRSTALPDGEVRGLSAIPSPVQPPLSVNSRKIPAACLQNVRTTKSHPPSSRRTRQLPCLDRAVAFCELCASLPDRPPSPARRQSAPPSTLCARTAPSYHAFHCVPALYFVHLAFPHYTLARDESPKTQSCQPRLFIACALETGLPTLKINT